MKKIDFKSIVEPLILVPFFGEPVPVKVRELTQAQIYACGGDEFSLIETEDDVQQLKTSLKAQVKYSDIMSKITKKALISPTYDEIMEQIVHTNEHKEIEEEIHHISARISQMPHGKARTELENMLNEKRVWFDLILPEDFISTITSYALGTTKSDIKDVTKKALLRAAILAKNGNDNPADHLNGNFTAFNNDDINARAWDIFYKEQKRKK